MSTIDLRPAGFARPSGIGRVPGGVDVGPGLSLDAAAAPGRAASQLGEAVFQLGLLEKRAEDAAATSRAQAQLTERLGELSLNFEGRDLRDSATALEAWRTEGGEIVRQVGEGAGLSRSARRDWENRAGEILSVRGVAVAQEARRRGEQARIADLQTGLETYANAAAAARNPAEAASAVDDAERSILALEAAGSLNPLQARQLRDRFQTQVSTARVTRAMVNNPGEAIRLLNDPALTPGLDADRRASLLVSAMNRQDAAAARAMAVTAQRERAVAAEIGQIDNLMLRGLIPEERLTALRESARGTALEPVVARLERDARQIGGWVSLPAERQAAELERLQGELRANPTPEALAQFERLARITEAQQRDVAQDGLGRAVADGIVGRLPALNLTDPASLNARSDAAAAASLHYGRPVSIMTRAEAGAVARQFVGADVDTQMALIQGIAGMSDAGARQATFGQLEAARGESGRLPAGTLARVGDMVRSGDFAQMEAARRTLERLQVDVSAVTRDAGTTTALNAALATARGRGVQGVVAEQGRIAGAEHLSILNRDMDIIQRGAAALIAQGMTPDRAVQAAQDDLNLGRGVINATGVRVFFPTAEITERQMRDGLARLRATALEGLNVDPAQGADRVREAMDRRDAIRSAEWVNLGYGQYGLVALGRAGRREVIMRADLDTIRNARPAPVAPNAPSGRPERQAPSMVPTLQ